MRLTHYFLPLLKEAPAEARIASHRLMLRAGLVRQASAGIYSWLPLGFKVLEKISGIVRREQERAGAMEMLMPTIQSADIWQRSGRYADYGAEMLKIEDRQGRHLLYGPTNEELITQIVARDMVSYKDAGRMLFHIQWKFRDEIRPRFGVMRGREFLMKDGYSFDVDEKSARNSYNGMFISYLRTFQQMGLRAIPIAADTGPIGGDLSHEFVILAETGESEIFCDKALLELDVPGADAYDAPRDEIVARWTNHYAAEKSRHDAARFESEVKKEARLSARGIEVGHIFFFGDKYTKPLEAYVTDAEGKRIPLQCGSYGIGVSRLVGAIVEASHDERGIIWPDPVAPFTLGLVNMTPNNETCTSLCDDIYEKCRAAGAEILYDDTEARAGAKLSGMDLIGLPWRIIVGQKGAGDGRVSLERRDGSLREEMMVEKALTHVLGK